LISELPKALQRAVLNRAGASHAELDRLHKHFRFNAAVEGDTCGADRVAGEWARASEEARNFGYQDQPTMRLKGQSR